MFNYLIADDGIHALIHDDGHSSHDGDFYNHSHDDSCNCTGYSYNGHNIHSCSHHT
jgi:hypothetical protein